MRRGRLRAGLEWGLVAGIVALTSVLPEPVQGQGILNTERFQLADVDGFHLGADLSVSAQRGNARFLNASASGIVGTLTDRHWPRIIFGGKYLSDDERSLLDQQFVQLRYSHILSPRTRTFHFVQGQRNETLLLTSRWLLGTGVRTTVLHGETASLSVGTGLMGEWEELDPEELGPDDPASTSTLRMANLAVLSWELRSGARILNILYVQPDLQALRDLRLLNDLGLLLPLTDRIWATVSLEWRRDTRPPSTLERDDLVLSTGLRVDVH